MPFKLKEQLVFYGVYHREPTNVKIHMACVPVLLVTAFLFGTNTPSLPTPPLLNRLNLPLNLGTLTAISYSTLYTILSPNLAGISLTPLLLASASLVNRLKNNCGAKKATTVALSIHIISWILQFVGHGKFEGRKPALLDNLAQALFLAPLFVWYEVLFRLGFAKKLRREVEDGVNEEVNRMKAEKK